MDKLRFAVLGTGFWARYQLAGWMELDGLECVALCDSTRSKAQAMAYEFGVPKVYNSPEELFESEALDFVDIITDVESHANLTQMAAKHGLHVICQKPMARSLVEAQEMVNVCHKAGVQLLINENWRWQHPIRQLKSILLENPIGRVFRAHIHYCNSFPIFANQPKLRELEQFILSDMGSHIFDTARFLFGNATRIYCQTSRVHRDIKGEDVATVLMEMGEENIIVLCELSYASRTEIERFPQTYIYIEGDRGRLELGPDYVIRQKTAEGVWEQRYPPKHYSWADPAYDLGHSSIVDAQSDLLAHLKGNKISETTGDDNLKTVALVFGAYESANTGQPVFFREESDLL